jgi:glyoxylase-like metal-dependent hydrolase (beta-lactamase superfamily II)
MPSRHFQKIADGVYYATSTGSMTVGANACIIVNDEDVFVLDPGESPASARALVEDIKTITDKPIRFVANSHFHFDHSHGNQIFGPEVMLIAPDRSYDRLSGRLGNVLEQEAYATQATPALLQQRLDALKAAPQPSDPQELAMQKRQIAALELRIPQEKEIKPTPPNMTFSTRLTLHRGKREIQLLYLGRGHTDTDLFLYLPQERIVCTGDMMESNLSYMASAWVNEWPAALERLLALDFETALPGHGTPFQGKDKVRAFQSYLVDLQKQVDALRKQGLPPQEAVKRIDMSSHKADFPQARSLNPDIRAVQRIYDVAANPDAPLR